MKRVSLAGAMAWAAFALVVGLAEEPPRRLAGSAQWLADFEAAQRIARKEGKPIFLVFRCER